jgi:hypothetical protein
MKINPSLWTLVLVISVASLAAAQESAGSGWRIMPSALFIQYLPGEQIRDEDYKLFFDDVYAGYKYSGVGLSFNVRCFTESIRNVALTFGSGVNWFSVPRTSDYAVPEVSGIGSTLHRQDFRTFPLTAGLQFVQPYDSREQLMFYIGPEVSVHFVSGNVDITRQTQVGFNVVGGFAVKIFEFGIRYSSFSDLKNIAAHLGVRFNSFDI